MDKPSKIIYSIVIKHTGTPVKGTMLASIMQQHYSKLLLVQLPHEANKNTNNGVQLSK
jgi:hypothetical protein